MTFKHFSIDEREKIQEMLWHKASMRSIARALGRSPSSVAREFNRNRPLQYKYLPRVAHTRALEKRSCRGRKLRLKSGFIRRYVVAGLISGLSPEQISGRLHYEHPRESISHEAIYRYIYAQVHKEGRGLIKKWRHDLRPYLKRRHKYRRKQGLRRPQRVCRPKGPSIDARPKEVERRNVIGHWETDSMVSRQSSVGLNTIVERKTGLVFITRIKNGTALKINIPITNCIGRKSSKNPCISILTSSSSLIS